MSNHTSEHDEPWYSDPDEPWGGSTSRRERDPDAECDRLREVAREDERGNHGLGI